MTPHILVVDDEKAILNLLSDMLKDEGFIVSSAENGYQALKQIEKEEPDLVLLDIYMPGINGIETLKEIKKNNTSIPVIIISSYGNIDNAVYATKLGAYDFIEKPLSIDKTLVSIKNALEYQRLEEENRYLKKKNLDKNSFTGNSEKINQLRGQLFQAGLSDDNVIINGENGTGKKLAARNIHFLSQRSEFPMITINCACLPKDSAQVSLFGCAREYLGKDTPKIKGKLELSDNSTLFLEEITEIDIETQSKILEFIENKKISRLGESREIKVNTRVIATTSKDIEQEMEKGSFTKELFYRLNVININIPPLRDRMEDIVNLLDHFLYEASESYNVERKTLTNEAIDKLKQHTWPGNVRELKNLANSLTLMNDIIELKPEHLPPAFSGDDEGLKSEIPETDDYETALKNFKKIFISRKLVKFKNDYTKVSKKTGLSEDLIKKIIES